MHGEVAAPINGSHSRSPAGSRQHGPSVRVAGGLPQRSSASPMLVPCPITFAPTFRQICSGLLISLIHKSRISLDPQDKRSGMEDSRQRHHSAYGGVKRSCSAMDCLVLPIGIGRIHAASQLRPWEIAYFHRCLSLISLSELIQSPAAAQA